MTKTLFLAVATAVIGTGAATPSAAQDSMGGAKASWPYPIADRQTYTFALFDLAEYRRSRDDNPVSWDLVGWTGGDYRRFWFKSEGDAATAVRGSGAWDLQALYGSLIAPFWDVQLGARVQGRYGDGARARVQAVLGLQGLAPYWFELEPAVYVSQDGDISAQLTASYDLLVTQRLIAQPRLEMQGAVQAVPAYGVGSGLNSMEFGFRIRYELRREYGPYLGVNWQRRFAGTADLARQAGKRVSEFAIVGGLRVWF